MKLFRSNGADIRVASLNGQVAIISSEFRELPESLWPEAYAMGAISSDMTAAPSVTDYVQQKKKEQEEKEITERAELKTLFISLYDNPKDVVNNAGQLVHRKIVQLVGRPLKRDFIDEIWNEVVAEMKVEK